MKTIPVFVSLIFLTLLGACKGKSTGVLTNATGAQGEIVVVVKDNLWDASTGNAIRYVLESPTKGLSVYEPALTVSHVDPQYFNHMFKIVRNILLIEVNPSKYTKASIKTSRNRWARNQSLMAISAPDTTVLDTFMINHQARIVDYFVNAELKRNEDYLTTNYSDVAQQKIKNRFDVQLRVPEKMTFYKDTTDFFWTSNNAGTGRRDIVMYTFPYVNDSTFTRDYLIAMRDSVMKANIPGGFPDSYMTTEKRVMPEYKAININGKYAGELRGLWRMEGDMMGGPFVSIARVDEKNHRIVVAEGFVYSPESETRNYIRQLEAAIKTLRFPYENEQAANQK